MKWNNLFDVNFVFSDDKQKRQAYIWQIRQCLFCHWQQVRSFVAEITAKSANYVENSTGMCINMKFISSVDEII